MNDTHHETLPPPSWMLWIWLASWPVAGAIGGWAGDDFLGWGNFLAALGGGIVVASFATATSWFRFPVRNEDGSYYLRSLLAVVVAFGGIGGIFVGLTFWLMACIAAALTMQLPSDWGDGMAIRAVLGGILGGFVAGLAAWRMKNRPSESH